MDFILLIIGLALLVKGADWIVEGAQSLARRFQIAPLIIGIAVISVGTSLPELIIAIFSAFEGTPEISFGNIVGSNLSNTLLVLGVASIIFPPSIPRVSVQRDVLFSILAAVVLLAMSNISLTAEGQAQILGRAEGAILLLFAAAYIYYLHRTFQRDRRAIMDEAGDGEVRSLWRIIMLLALGTIGLYLGGDFTVDSTVSIARRFGIPDVIISATIIAIGTSLPELAAAATASLRRSEELAFGNIMGSNIINVFVVLGIASIILPIQLPGIANQLIAILVASSLLLLAFMFLGQNYTLERWKGAVLLAGFVAYVTFLFIRLL